MKKLKITTKSLNALSLTDRKLLDIRTAASEHAALEENAAGNLLASIQIFKSKKALAKLVSANTIVAFVDELVKSREVLNKMTPITEGYLVPRIQTFKDALSVHFSRAAGCALTDEELKEHLEGTVIWELASFTDHETVTDKYGEIHKPKRLSIIPD